MLSSLAAGRLARRFRQRALILAGFAVTITGIIVLLALVKGHPGASYFALRLFLIGAGLGIMLTLSVNVVQSDFPENLQGEISGLSRSVSNLGSSIGTAIAGTILVAGLADPSRPTDCHGRPGPHRPDRPARDHVAASRRARTRSRRPGSRRAPPVSGREVAGKAGRVTSGDRAGRTATVTGLGLWPS